MTNFVSSMSQLDKVLHLYVEVRSLEEGKELHGGDNRSNLRMLHGPDVLPHLHKELAHTSPSHSPDFSPKNPHRSRALSQSLPFSRCSSRQTVNFQLPHQNDAIFPSATVCQNSLCGSVGQLSDLHSPGMPHSGLNGPYIHSSECASQKKWVPSSTEVGRWSVPSTPTSYRRFYDKHGADDEDGTTSVVRYGFVEKASINTGSQHPPQNYYDKDDLFQKHIHFQKRNSDPGGHYDPENYFLSHHRPVIKIHNTPPQFRRGTFESVAKDATHRALREFGSPELKRRYESYSHENGSINLPQHQRPQQSWSSSPSPNVCRKGPALSPRNSQYELAQGQGHTVVSVPHTPQHCPSSAASPSLNSRRLSPHLQSRLVASQHTKSYTQTHLPAGKPTDIQHSISARNIPTNQNGTNAFQTSSRNYPSENDRNLITVKNANKRHAAERTLSPEGDQPFAPSCYNLEKGSKCVADGRRYSQSDRATMSSSPVPFIDPRVLHRANTNRQDFCCESQPNTSHYWRKASHHLHPHYQTDIKNHGSPLTMGGNGFPPLSPKCYLSSKCLSLPSSLNYTDFSHCPEMQLEHSPCFNNGMKPEAKTHQYPCVESRAHHQVSARSVRSSPEATRRNTLGPQPTSVNRTSKSEVQSGDHSAIKEQKYENKTFRERPEMKPVRKTHLEVYPTSTHSKVTQTEDHHKLGHAQSGKGTETCTSAKTNHDLRGSTVRSEKIAKAKWDFLFGDPSEECCCTEASDPLLAPTRHSTAPGDSVGQRLLHHKVQQIEVELFTPDSCGSSSGIIRRRLKYSETDLDAVPLRCYRETDLDQVMQAGQEVFEENEVEVDSAFGSDRSILGASNFSPEDVEGKEKGSKDVESRVMPSGHDERGIRISKEIIRPLETVPNTHCPMKSPVSLSSPRCTSDGNLDSFSRHFESIMESHRAKGTSYSSLDSVDVLTSGSTSVFTFDLPTLTPEIQTQISDTARQLMDLSFAPLSRTPLSTASSEVSPCTSNRIQVQPSSNKATASKDCFKKVSSAPSLREHVKRPPELLYPQADVAQRLARADSIDALNGIKADLQAAKRLAQRLYSLDGFKKSDVARHLNKNNDFSHMVAEEYLSLFDFSGLTIDQALRLFLRRFALVGETQERERLLTHFSHRYTQCNPQCLNTEDNVHTLTCAVMLLNSDLHGNNVGKRMSCSQFISNLEGLNDGKDFPKELLKTLYTSIRSEKLQWTIDEEETQKPGATVVPDARKDSASHTLKRQGPSGNPLLSMAQQAKEQLYKSGLLVRKVHADQDGKRTPRGKRGWKSFYGTLKGLVLYLQKEEYRLGQELAQEDLKNAVSIHHSLAMRAADYSKRANVFYLRTADWRVFLFQAPSAEQMQSWITHINIVSAMFSAPPFPPAIGSQKRFSRPLLPGSNTKLSQEEQLNSHENRFRAVSSELVELIAESKEKGREVEEQKQRQEYLEFEKTRYGTYAMLMRAKLQFGTEDLSTFESRLLSEGGLQRAHSSPALPQYSSLKDKGSSGRSKSLKVTSIQTKEESQNGTKPDCKAESKNQVP